MKRSWYQVHLSTLLICSVTASALMFRNSADESSTYYRREYGWPFVAYDLRNQFDINLLLYDSKYATNFLVLTNGQVEEIIAESGRWHSSNVAIDAAVFVIVVVVVGLLNEVRCRRNERGRA